MPARPLVIPKAATLRGRRYRIYKRLNKGMQDRNLRGECEVDEPPFVINLDPNQSRKELEATWVHELLHAIWPQNIVDIDTEEKLVLGLEYRLRDAVARGYLRAEE